MGSTSVYLTLWVVGLMGGVHCMGMCGGVVSALSLNTQKTADQRSNLPVLMAYNIGRLSSYALAGAIAGAIGGIGFAWLKDQWLARIFLFSFANLMLLALGIYLMGMPKLLHPVERLGQRLWARIQPLTRPFFPVRGVAQALPLGLLWGWLPCGMVYSALTTSISLGNPVEGAVAMLAFGFGTLPNLLLAGLFAQRLRGWTQNVWVRRTAGGVVLLFAFYGFWGVINMSRLWLK